jgi:hypothetical protein
VYVAWNQQDAIDEQTAGGDILDFRSPLKPLLHFDGGTTAKCQASIPFGFEDYLALVDWTGRIMRSDKRGYIDSQLPPDSRSTAHFSRAMACQQHAIRSHSSKAIQSREPAAEDGIGFTHKTGSPRSAHASGRLPVVQIPSSAEI